MGSGREQFLSRSWYSYYFSLFQKKKKEEEIIALRSSIAIFQAIYSEKLQHFKALDDYENEIYFSQNRKNIHKDLQEILIEALEKVKGFSGQELKSLLHNLEKSIQKLDIFQTNISFSPAFSHENFIVPLLDDTWNVKFFLEKKRDILQNFYPENINYSGSKLDFMQLPNEIIQYIFSFLSQKELLSQLTVSKFYMVNAVAYLNSPRKIISDISEIKDPIAMVEYLNRYRQKEAYKKLAVRKFATLSPVEAVCFVLTRKPKDTKNLTFDNLFSLISRLKNEKILPYHVIESIVTTFFFIKYSNLIESNSQAGIRKWLIQTLGKRLSVKERQKNLTFINLGGLNLTDFDFRLTELCLVDFSGSIVKNACFCANGIKGAILFNTQFAEADVYAINSQKIPKMTSPLFFPEKCAKDVKTFKLTLDLLSFAVQRNKEPLFLAQWLESLALYLKTVLGKLNKDTHYKLKLLEEALNHCLFNWHSPVQKYSIRFFNKAVSYFISNDNYWPTDHSKKILLAYKEELTANALMAKRK